MVYPLVTQQGGTWAPGSFYFNPSHPCILPEVTQATVHKIPSFGLCYLESVGFSAQPWVFQYPGLLFGPLCSLLLLLPWWGVLSQYFILHSGIYQNALPAAAGARCGGTDFKKAMLGALCAALGQNGARHFTVVLHSNVFNGK